MYLDPGFGSMLIQLLIAFLAAAGVMLGIFRTRIRAFFQRNKPVEDAKEAEESENNDDHE